MDYSQYWTFQDAATQAQDGNTIYPNKNDKITVFITGTSSTRTIYFEGSDNEGNWYATPAFKLPTFTLASSTTGNNEAWEIDTSNFISYRCRIGAISGGNCTIKGKVVNMNG